MNSEVLLSAVIKRVNNSAHFLLVAIMLKKCLNNTEFCVRILGH